MCKRGNEDALKAFLGVISLIGDCATKQDVLQGISSVSLIHIDAHGGTDIRSQRAAFLLKRTTIRRWRTFHKLNCQLNWWYLAVVTALLDRLESRELLVSLKRSKDPVLAQCWGHGAPWATRPQSSLWLASMSTFSTVKVNLFTRSESGWETVALMTGDSVTFDFGNWLVPTKSHEA